MRNRAIGAKSGAPLFLRIVTPLLRAGPIARLRPAPRTVFILSTGRTGTVYLSDLIKQLDGVLSLHEPKPSRVLNAWTTAYLEGQVSRRYMAAALASKRRKTLQATQQSGLYVESSNFIAGFADALEEIFDNPTIIHLVRDPRDFATSLTNRGDDVGIRGFFNRFVPYWAYVPPGMKKRQLTVLTRPAYRWVAINEYLSGFSQRRANYHRFTFEKVFETQDSRELKRLLQTVGLTAAQIKQLDFGHRPRPEQSRFTVLDPPSSSVNASKHDQMRKWRDWTDEEKRTFDAICGPLMRHYGYGTEQDWPDTHA